MSESAVSLSQQMSREIRSILGQPVRVPEWYTFDSRLHPTYEEDMANVAKTMHDNDYTDICVLGPTGSHSDEVATSLLAALAVRQESITRSLKTKYRDNEARRSALRTYGVGTRQS